MSRGQFKNDIVQKDLKKYFFIILVVAFSLAVRLRGLSLPLSNSFHDFRQTQTAIIIQNYFREGWSLRHYSIPVFGYPYNTVMFECPIYQTIVYFLMLLFKQENIDYCARIISLILFYCSAGVLKKFVDQIADEKYSEYVCVLYLLLPFNIYWSTAVLIDYTSVLFALIYGWGLYGWLQRKKGRQAYYLAALVFGSLGYLLKSTTMFPVVFFLAFLIIRHYVYEILNSSDGVSWQVVITYFRNNLFHLAQLLVLCCLPVLAGLLWTQYADIVKESSEYTQWLTSGNLSFWNYGTLEQKINIDNWKIIFERLFGMFGVEYIFWLLVAVYIFNCGKKNLLVIVACFFSVILTVFSLFNLYYVHDYYFIALTPFVCIFYGIILCDIVRKLLMGKEIGQILISTMVVVLVYVQIHGNTVYLDALKATVDNHNVGLYVNKITDETERVVIEGEDWSPAIMYYAERKGFMIRNSEWLTQEFCESFLRDENYTTLVAHNLNMVSLMFSNFDTIIQYPAFNNPYVYKFYEADDFDALTDGYEYVNCNFDGYSYLIQDMHTPYICLEYQNGGVELPIVITSKTGEEYRDTITLLSEKNRIFYNMKELCDNPQTLRFEGDGSMVLSVKY